LAPGPLATRRRPPEEAPPVQDHGWRPLQVRSPSVAFVRVAAWPSILATPLLRHDGLLPRWPAALRSVAVAQANWPCTWPRPCAVAAPKTFAVGLGIVPQTQPVGPKLVRFAPQVFRVCASMRDYSSSPSDDSRSPRTTIRVTRPAAQRERRRGPRNANSSECHAGRATRPLHSQCGACQHSRRAACIPSGCPSSLASRLKSSGSAPACALFRRRAISNTHAPRPAPAAVPSRARFHGRRLARRPQRTCTWAPQVPQHCRGVGQRGKTGSCTCFPCVGKMSYLLYSRTWDTCGTWNTWELRYLGDLGHWWSLGCLGEIRS
jgi:hypothetical protein